MPDQSSLAVRMPDPLVLIGGGDVMLHTAQAARAAGLRVAVILAPRHAEEILPLGRQNTFDAFRAASIPTFLIEDLNANLRSLPGQWIGSDALALCFGPAWIFDDTVRYAFGAGMINYNPIPVPRYLGGAHYTWQILQGDRNGGVILQLITDKLDRGPILKANYFDIPPTARTPADYFKIYTEHGNRLLDEMINSLIECRSFTLTRYEEVNERRLYLPRLYTLRNGWIDWRWSGQDIERFCCAFDEPYKGAGTLVDGHEIHLKDVYLEEGERCHPFLSGLVVRRLKDRVWVAVSDGLLRIGQVAGADDTDAKSLLREGQRLVTPPEKLYEALAYRPTLSGKPIS
jgi:methionyl-tRNA formyltransferase